MKRTIRIIDKTKNGNNKIISQEVNVRDYDHFLAQSKVKSQIFEDKRKKKAKHKSDYLVDYYE